MLERVGFARCPLGAQVQIQKIEKSRKQPSAAHAPNRNDQALRLNPRPVAHFLRHGSSHARLSKICARTHATAPVPPGATMKAPNGHRPLAARV